MKINASSQILEKILKKQKQQQQQQKMRRPLIDGTNTIEGIILKFKVLLLL